MVAAAAFPQRTLNHTDHFGLHEQDSPSKSYSTTRAYVFERVTPWSEARAEAVLSCCEWAVVVAADVVELDEAEQFAQ